MNQKKKKKAQLSTWQQLELQEITSIGFEWGKRFGHVGDMTWRFTAVDNKTDPGVTLWYSEEEKEQNDWDPCVEQMRGQRQTGRNDLPGKDEKVA